LECSEGFDYALGLDRRCVAEVVTADGMVRAEWTLLAPASSRTQLAVATADEAAGTDGAGEEFEVRIPLSRYQVEASIPSVNFCIRHSGQLPVVAQLVSEADPTC
jgi:hypothetical protein